MNEENQPIENKDEKNVGFRTALYLDLPKIDERLKELSEGVENLRLNSNIITPTLTPRTSDPKTFEYLKNCISSDLLRRLEESSPIKSNTPGLHRKISEIFLLNCENRDEKESNFALTEKNDKEDKVKDGSKFESPEVNFDEKAFDLKNLKQNTKNYLPKNTATIMENQSLNSSKLSGNERDEDKERPAIPISFNVEKSESPRHKPAKYPDSKSSPIFNYYNDTSEYFSQIFIGNYNNNNNSNKLVEKKNSNEFFKLHLLRKEDSRQGSSNNLLSNEQVNGNNFNEREKLNISNFSGNVNENAQTEGKSDFNNFPILSRLPQKANLNDKIVNPAWETNGLVNGKSLNSSINENKEEFIDQSKNSRSNFHNPNNKNTNNNINVAKNAGNFTKLNYNQPQNNYMNRGPYDENNFSPDNFNQQQAYFQNNFDMMNQNGTYAFPNSSNENAYFSKMPTQNFNFTHDNYNMNQFFKPNNANQNYIENGDNNSFINNYNRQQFNYQNFDMNDEEQMKNQFWQKNFGKKNNNINFNSSQNRSNNEHFNGNFNQNSNYTSKFDPEEYIVEMFGKRGWICEACNNFNYETRTKCNRCKIPKIPKKITNKKNKFNMNSKKNASNIENGNTPNRMDNSNTMRNDNQNFQNSLNPNANACFNNGNELQNMQNFGLNQTSNINNPDTEGKPDELNSSMNSNERKNKKPFMERVGDWVCIKCKNLNFSFRVMCNRCQMTKYESERLTDQYLINYSNYIKFNEMMQQRILMNNPMNIPNNPGFSMNNPNFSGNSFLNNNSDFPTQGFIESKANFPRMPNNLDGFDDSYFQNMNYPFHNNYEEGFGNQEDYDNQGNLMIDNNMKMKVNGQTNNNPIDFKRENIHNAYNNKKNINSNDIGVEDS